MPDISPIYQGGKGGSIVMLMAGRRHPTVVIVRERVRPSAGPMAGRGGRSNNHGTWNVARLCINLPAWITGFPPEGA